VITDHDMVGNTTIKEVNPVGIRYGYVYIIKASNGLCKIGMACTSPQFRLQRLSGMSPCKLELIFATDEIREPSVLESTLHKCLDSKRSHGEWFHLTEVDIQYIIKYCGYWTRAREGIRCRKAWLVDKPWKEWTPRKE